MASGPACIACFLAAKMKYENGITDVSQLPPEISAMAMDLFQKGGCSWPFDLIDRWSTVDFTKVHPMSRWWFEKKEPECDHEMI